MLLERKEEGKKEGKEKDRKKKKDRRTVTRGSTVSVKFYFFS